jgi:hypothetical protein
MGVPRQRPSHRVRQWASGLPRPISGKPILQERLLPQPQPFSDLAIYFAEFNPDDEEEAQDIVPSPLFDEPLPELRLRSAPWDDILKESEVSSIASSSDHTLDDQESIQELDSWQRNLLPRTRNPPTFYNPVLVPALPPDSPLLQLNDTWVSYVVQHGVDLPPPQHAPRVFKRTQPSLLMDQVINDFIRQGILQPQPIVAAYRAFLVPKSSGAARFVMDLSPLTPFYLVPHITLYSAASLVHSPAMGSNF